MERPTRYDECVKRRAAELALPEVKQWLGQGFATDDEIIEDLMDCIGEDDGFAIVSELKERKHWECDSQLVEILDGNFIHTAKDELEKQWVKCLGVKLDIPIGTQVQFKNPKRLRMGTSGEVVKHYPESAKYGVRTPDQPKTSNWILLPEDIEVVA
jgi:hypothetical protein